MGDKKAEKLRLAAEKKAAKEAEKAAKKAEKERIAAQKKAAKDAKKLAGKGKQKAEPVQPESSNNSVDEKPAPSTSESSEVGVDIVSPTKEDSGDTRGNGGGATPVLGAKTGDDDGVGCIAQAWLAAHGADDTSGEPSIQIKHDQLDDNEHYESIGEGGFGMVYESGISTLGGQLGNRLRDDSGTVETTVVVIKKLSNLASAEARAAFLQEAVVMEKIDHPNVVRLVGSCTQFGDPMLMVFEAHTDTLHAFLTGYSQRKEKLTVAEQAKLGRDVARGLDYLHSHDVIHRDIAARNCVVNAEHTVRIGDMGLSKSKYPGDYAEVGGVAAVPVRWLAPESLQDATVFTKNTDVWSLGVTLWEICSRAQKPYRKLATAEVAEFVIKGGAGDAIKGLDERLQNTIAQCCTATPTDRPAAGATAQSLTELHETEAAAAAAAAITAAAAAVSGGGYDAPTDAVAGDEAATGGDGPSRDSETRFSKLKKARKSYRCLGQYKDAEVPGDALDAATSTTVPEIDRARLAMDKELGQGAFGVVMKAKMDMPDGSVCTCACKTLKDSKNADDMDALVAEAELVSQFDHKNVVKCFGYVTVGEPPMIVFEFMSNGSLFSYLHGLPDLPKLQRLMRMAIDVACGMEYLAQGNNVHRDLAARNILVSEEIECKISDFGLSRDLDDDTYYESDGGMVPIRWTPPEAYKYKKYSTASDVWSYGITLYEIWTKGALPYGKKWTNMNVMMEVEKGYRLEAPPKCPKAVYQLMLQCWNPMRRSRPTFASIKDRLEMAYDMMFPPEEEAVVAEDPDLDLDYGDMDQMYYGVPVPTEDTLDVESNYLSEPAPVKPSQALQLGKELQQKQEDAATDAKKAYKGKNVAQKPDRFSHLSSPKEKRISQTPAGSSPLAGGGGGHPANSPRLSTGAESTLVKKSGSLRRQRVVSQMVQETDNTTVEYTHSAKVSDMIKLSNVKETQSALEETGLERAHRVGLTTTPIQKVEYVESVGRATDVTPMRPAGGRKRCVCRRFKCVCGAR
eukprot:m.654831 g.654831  ORF g.654831 m.654831 type:complete len:1020 (+) comp22692_c0_seq1:441-3500(+)